MSLQAAFRERSISPASSGRSTPVPRASRRAEDHGAAYKGDKALRKYAAIVERALSTWETSPEEWADYIAFLGRLLKAIQSHPQDVTLLPHSSSVASKLSQCMNPALPSGVHQKALEVYSYIFSTFGHRFVAEHLDDYFPGLAAVLSFASLSVRPVLYDVLEEHIISLPTSDLRPLLKALILSLLPALEEETSEDFERAFRILETLERKFGKGVDSPVNGESNGFFWQCLFLAIITSPSRRQGALNFLVHKLPKFESKSSQTQNGDMEATHGSDSRLSADAEAVVSPEPGLLLRAFICGLSDPQLLVQRGFLDLLVTNLPLDSPLLQSMARTDDFDRLTHSAMSVLLRREMSLNRRLWSWFLGPDPKNDAASSQPSSPIAQRAESGERDAPRQLQYFTAFGKASLERCVLAMFHRDYKSVAERARPFRLCLSLMDRWEIGGSIVPKMFLPAMESTYEYGLKAPAADTTELVRSASLFFDSIEPSLIWFNILQLIDLAFSSTEDGMKRLELCQWMIQRFNLKDEEMVTSHIPRCVVYLLSHIQDSMLEAGCREMSLGLEISLQLLEIIPERALSSERSPQNGVDSLLRGQDAVRGMIKRLYADSRASEQQVAEAKPERIAFALHELSISLTLQMLHQGRHAEFVQAVSFLSHLQNKAANPVVLQSTRFTTEALALLQNHSDEIGALSFPTIASFISLVGALKAKPSTRAVVSNAYLRQLESTLTPQIWRYLSPSCAKYDVEATKTLWQLHNITAPSKDLEATLTKLVRPQTKVKSNLAVDPTEAVHRFGVLWSHSVCMQSPSTTSGPPGSIRRASTMPAVDTKQSATRQEALHEPMMMILDFLSEPNDPECEAALRWIQNLPTLELVLRVHFEMLEHLTRIQPSSEDDTSRERDRAATTRTIDYVLGHFQSLLQNRNKWISRCLNEMQLSASVSGLVSLAQHCCDFICDPTSYSLNLERKAMSVLDLILSGPDTASLKMLELDVRLIDKLLDVLDRSLLDTQSSLLHLITEALKLRTIPDGNDSETASHHRPRTSISAKRPSTAGLRPSVNAQSASSAPAAPSKLLLLLKRGFSSPTARSHLDMWLEFLSGALPVFSDAIFAGLLPLVGSLCKELDTAHSELVQASLAKPASSAISPESTIMALLEAMEMVLARAHQCLEDEEEMETEQRPAQPTRGLLSNVTSGVFKTEGPPSRTAHANSRLTVVLAFQDAIRVSLRLWTWANHSSEANGYDKASAATTSHNALKVRNRTRHLLEQIFAVEPLESLEVVVSSWRSLAETERAAAPLNLLHVLQVTRPKNVIPAILDALCSRTNPSALPSDRLSTQSTDLAAIDVAVFLSAYLDSTEDDAMDEVWSDCMAFLRDVLANPLPYRHVLPALLLTVMLLAQKIENTNFGEQRKMRKELGDTFNRLLTAAFTTMPSGYVQDPRSSEEHLSRGEKPCTSLVRGSSSLIAALKETTASVDIILETTDRTTAAMNSISSNLIGPVLRAKSFPKNITPETLDLLLQIAKKAPQAKAWKKELAEAFNDPRLLSTTPDLMATHWLPILCQWCLHDKERVPELLSRLAPPSSAGIMFGVGANAARLEADRKTQLNIRRICILLLASPEDSFALHMRTINEKLSELFEATAASSPSANIKAELFMLCRALVLSTGSVQLAPMWPVINENLHAALASLLPKAGSEGRLSNLGLLQACKLLDQLITLSPDEFQLHEWLYVTDSIDAVYRPLDWDPASLSDQIASVMASEGIDEVSHLVPRTPLASATSGQRRLLLDSNSLSNRDDFKAMAREDFAQTVLQPFLSQLSMYAYEAVYGMSMPDLDACRRSLVDDLLDLTTVVE